MQATAEHFLWLDITAPREEDAALLRNVFGFHPLAVEDAMKAHERAKIEVHDDHYFIIFYAVRYPPQSGRLERQALHLFVGRHYLVTVHREPIPQIDETLRRWQAPDTPFPERTGTLVYVLLDAIIDDHFPVLDTLAERIDEIEDVMFIQDEQRDPTPLIFEMKKTLLRFRRAVAPGRDVLNVLLRRERSIFKREDEPYLQDLYDHVVRLTENIDLYRDLLSSALDSYLSFQSNRLNQIVKVLTVASIILMANALIAGIYGMNFEVMPELRWPYGYPFALGLMVLSTTGLVLFFRRKRWI